MPRGAGCFASREFVFADRARTPEKFLLMNFPTRIVFLLAIAACFCLSALAQEAPPAPTPNPPAQSAPPPDAPPTDTPQPSHADQGQDDKEKTNQRAPQQQPGASNPRTGSKPSHQAGEKQNADQSTAPANHGVRPGQQQPKRILGVMSNFRAVSAGAIPPPPTAKESFLIASQNSFDYSSFVFVGVTSALAEWTVAHPQLGQGLPVGRLQV